MKLKLLSAIILFSLSYNAFGYDNLVVSKKIVKAKRLYAMVEPGDSGSSITLKEADKKAEAAKNNRSRFFPIFFSPLLIIIIVIAAKRRKKRQEEEKSKK